MRFVLLILMSIVPVFSVQAKALRPFGQENAVWAGSIFLRGFDPTSGEKLTDEKLKDLATRLKRNGICYVYLFAGPYGKDGRLPSYAFSARARESVAFLKRTNPSLKVLPWIGGVEGKTVHLEDENWMDTSVRETARLVTSVSFDGVHVDLESILFPKKSASTLPIDRYDKGWVEFHRKLREKLPSAFLSTAVVSSAPGTHPWKHKHELKDLIEVSHLVNQVAFMFYDTHLSSADSYRENMRLQLEQIQKMKSDLKEASPQYLFGIGTFKSEKALAPYRDMRFENIETTLTTLKELIGKLAFPARIIDGLAVYCDWTTRPKDWKQIRTLWTNR